MLDELVETRHVARRRQRHSRSSELPTAHHRPIDPPRVLARAPHGVNVLDRATRLECMDEEPLPDARGRALVLGEQCRERLPCARRGTRSGGASKEEWRVAAARLEQAARAQLRQRLERTRVTPACLVCSEQRTPAQWGERLWRQALAQAVEETE